MSSGMAWRSSMKLGAPFVIMPPVRTGNRKRRRLMTTPNLSEAERARRSEYARESKAACARGETLEARAKQREGYANDWASWFRQRMDRSGCDDPAELLPDALAK